MAYGPWCAEFFNIPLTLSATDSKRTWKLYQYAAAMFKLNRIHQRNLHRDIENECLDFIDVNQI